jgi:putative ABC transport system substrate-binding protein
MIKRFISLAIALCVLPLFYVSRAEASDVIVLKSADIMPYNEALEGFRSSCGCRIDEQVHVGELGTTEVSSRLLRSNPDGVFVIGIDALSRVKRIRDVPVVYAMVPDAESLEAYGGNVSGVNMYIRPEEYLSAIRKVFPDAKRVGVLYDPGHLESFMREAVSVAESLGIDLVKKKVFRSQDVPSLIEGMKNKIDVYWMLPDATVVNKESVEFLLLFSFQNRVPVFTFSKKYVELGAVAGLNMTPFDMGVQAGGIMKKLLGGKDVKSPIRVETRKTVLTINSKVARKLGIRLREEVSKRAEDVN